MMNFIKNYRVEEELVLVAGVAVEVEVFVCVALALDALVEEAGAMVAVPSALVASLFADFEHSFLQDFLSLQHFLSANIVPDTNNANARKTIFFMFLNF